MRPFLLVVVALALGCGGSYCHQLCLNGLRDSLIRDFDVDAGSVDCNSAVFTNATSCGSCSKAMATTYGVVIACPP